MLIGAVLAAVSSAFCFAAGATLQQREAVRESSTSVLDPRLLWQLSHRPQWVLGIAADGLSAALHILALSLGSVALVQPLGVIGLLFAIPLTAIQRRRRIPPGDVASALAVLTGLILLLQILPTGSTSSMPATNARTVAVCVFVCVATAGCALLVARRFSGRTQALLLAGGAGACFGVTAALTRLFLEAVGHRAGLMIASGIGVVVLAVLGYWLQQNAYRGGHFAASLATATVVDPLAAIGVGVPLLGEPVPHSAPQILGALACAVLIAAGVAALVRSPAHLLTAVDPDPS